MAKDLIGPAAFGADNPAVVRPAFVPSNADGATDSWFLNCTSSTARDGTSIEAQFCNFLLAQIRRAIRGMGIAESNVDDDMLLKAIQAASSGGALPAHTHPESDITNLVADLSAINAAIAGKVSKSGDSLFGNLFWDNNLGTFFRNALAAFVSGSAGAGLFKGADNSLYLDNYEGAIVVRLAAYAEALSIAASGNIRVGGGGAAEAKFDVNGNAITRGEHRLKAASYPKVLFEATGNAADARKWQLYVDSSDHLNLKRINDAENAELAGTLQLNGAIGLAGDLGSAVKVFTGGSNAAWKTLVELGVGKKIIAIGTANSGDTINFATAEPDTSYSGIVLNGVISDSASNASTLGFGSISSKGTGSCVVSLGNTAGSPGMTGTNPVFYIIYR